MIRVRLSANGDPMTLGMMATVKRVKTISKEQPDVYKPSLCYCECRSPLPVFGKTGGTDLQKDRTSVLEKKSLLIDSVEFALIKDGEKVADLNNNTYGTFYDFGSINNDNLLTGYLVDWTLVLNSLGAGKYRIRTTKTIIGVETVIHSALYQLSQFTDLQADRTIRLDITNSGSIDRFGINLGDFDWFQSIRLHGELFKQVPDLEKDVYPDNKYDEQKYTSRTINNYLLEVHGTTQALADYFTDQFPHADIVQITDYNLEAYKNVNKLKIVTESFENFDTHQDYANFSINLREQTQNIIKRY